MNTLPHYRVILAYPPYFDWGVGRTNNIPVWRAIDLDCCLLVLVTHIDHLHHAYKTVSAWGFGYQSITVRRDEITMVGVIGNPTVPPTVGKVKKKRQMLDAYGSPKLLLNPENGVNKNRIGEWDVWSPFGFHGVDLFQYPIRRSYVAVDDVVLDHANYLRRIYKDGALWRFKLGDAINRMIESNLMSRLDGLKWAKEILGNQVSLPQLTKIAHIAGRVPENQRDPSISWDRYYHLYKQERIVQ
jgi:hypothetical protein